MIAEDYQEKSISALTNEILEMFVLEEITGLVNDFGQNMESDMYLHIKRRVSGVLNTKYKSWKVGMVHAAFQNGLSGAYGVFNKVTVKALLHFLNQAQKQLINYSATKAEEESDRKNRETIVFNDSSEFLAWASGKMICLEYVHPEWEPIMERAVSPKIKELAGEYLKAKKDGLLKSFEKRLRNEALKYAEI